MVITRCFNNLLPHFLSLFPKWINKNFLIFFSCDQDLTGEKSDKFFKLPAKNDSMAKDLLVSRLRRDPDAKKLPLYPNGWFRILESWELGLERVKYVAALGNLSM